MKNENKEVSIKKAAIINAASKYSNVFLMLAANVILARLLSVEDYGIVAVITVFVTFFNIFSDMGLSSGIIQNKQLHIKDINNIFTYTIYLSIFLGIAFWGIGYAVSFFYENNVYINICFLLSIAIFFNTANMIPNAVLMREKRFITVAVRSLVMYIISYIVSIVMALKGGKYYSLVAQSIIFSVGNFTWNLYSTRLKIILKPNFESLKKILSYSTYNFAYDIINYFARNLDNLLTGKFMGTSALGYYNKAYQLMLYPVNYLTNVVTPVLHPILSDYQKKKEIIYDKYMKVLKLLSILGLFFSIFCYFASDEIVLILYGEKWKETIPCIQVLSLSIWFQMTTSTCTSIFKSLGESKLRFKSGLLYIFIQVIMILIGVLKKDIIILSTLVAIGFLIRFFIEYYFLISKAFEKSCIKFFKTFLPEVIITVIVFSVMLLTRSMSFNNIYISFIVKGIVCCISYIFALCVSGQYVYIVGLLPKKIAKIFTIKKGENNEQ